MTLEAMVKAVNEGKTVIDEDGNKVFMDLEHEYGPYVLRTRDWVSCRVKEVWTAHDDFKILEEPKQEQITDRYELMELCRKWEEEGKRFLVGDPYTEWVAWQYYEYDLNIDEFAWTAIDSTGHPIGEPQKFMREVEDA